MESKFHTDECSMHKLLNVAELSSIQAKRSIFRFAESKRSKY